MIDNNLADLVFFSLEEVWSGIFGTTPYRHDEMQLENFDSTF